MAAIYYAIDNTKGMFKGSFPANHMVRIPALNDLMSSESAKSRYTVITDIAVETSDVLQFFTTFDDVINYFFFGKGLGNLLVKGMVFTDCDGAAPGLDTLTDTIGGLRGKKIEMSLGKWAFEVIITNSRISIAAEPVMAAEFTLTFAIVGGGPTPPQIQSACQS